MNARHVKHMAGGNDADCADTRATESLGDIGVQIKPNGSSHVCGKPGPGGHLVDVKTGPSPRRRKAG